MKVWTTKDGRELLISEMETDHINKTISLLRKSSNPMADKYIKVFCKELDRRKLEVKFDKYPGDSFKRAKQCPPTIKHNIGDKNE